MEFNIEKAVEYFETEKNITEAAKRHCKELKIPYEEKYRLRLSRYINSEKYDVDTPTIDTETNQYSNDKEKESDDIFMPSAWDSDRGVFLSIDEYCDKYNLPKEQVRSSKLVAHQQSHMAYNIAFNATLHEQTGIDVDFIEGIVKKYAYKVERNSSSFSGEKEWFDRLVITDVHIGMDVSGSVNVEPLYEGKWDEEELLRRLDIIVSHVKEFKKGENLVIDDLGDFLDGLGGQTTRKGHALPQNMSDKEVFDLGVKFKVSLVDKLLPYYKSIICNSVSEDNHSGTFSYFVNKTVKFILEEKYPNSVKYNVLERFIEHYSIGKHTFILSHGKDSESLKFGFKPHLDTKQIEKIDQYCKEYKLYDGNYLEFSKGDSHIGLFDDTTSNDFVYYNYPAFSPPSNWVKSNFKNSKSGFVMFNVDKNSSIKVKIPYYFEK